MHKKLIKNLLNSLTKVIQPHKEIVIHGTSHWEKVANIDAELASLANEPEEVIHAVIAAGLLHDIGRFHDSSRVDPNHGLTSVKIAQENKLLALLNVKKQYWDEIYDAIKNHTHGIKTSKTISKYLWDADRLCLTHFNFNIIDKERMNSSVWQKLCK